MPPKKKQLSAFSVYKEQARDEEKETAEMEESASMEPNGSSSGEKKQVTEKKRNVRGMTAKRKRKRAPEDDENEAPGPSKVKTKVVKKVTKWAKGKDPITRGKRKKAVKPKTKKRKKTEEDSDEDEEWVNEEEEEEEGDEEEEDVGEPNVPSPMKDYAAHNISMSASGETAEDGEPFFSKFDPDSYEDSREASKELLKMMISPVKIDQFFSDIWERRPVALRRHKPAYNDGWFCTKDLDCILRENELQFSTNIDVTTFEDGERLTHNPKGRAFPSTVWEFFNNGCSVRLLNPQSFSQNIWLLTSTLQEYFKSFVGANLYLTPAGTQGFAPHYDDIEAFVLQLEGRKHWRIYPPRNVPELLPRFSSPNFSDDEIGEPMMDVVLEPGDLLYFPRGTIHQANALPDSHSMHITLSTYQRNTWGDLLEKAIPVALGTAIKEDPDFRRGLPVDYHDFMGIINSDGNDPRRKEFMGKFRQMVSRLANYIPVDAAADQMVSDGMQSYLPPCLSEKEMSGGILAQGAQWEDDEVKDGIELVGSTRVKFIRHGIVRVVLEEDGPVLYYSINNSRVNQERPLVGLSITEEDASGVDHLLHSYPGYVTIEGIAMGGDTTEKVDLCYTLYNNGLLAVETNAD